MIRVAVVDDHDIVRRGLAAALEATADLRCVASVAGAAELTLDEVDVVVLDLTLGAKSGVDELARLPRGTRVVVYSMHEEGELAARAVRAGARAFVTKSAPVEKLLDAIRAVAAGEQRLSETLRARARVGEDSEVNLSAREHEVLDRLVAGESLKQIGRELGIASSTLSTYTRRIKDKLGVDTIGGAVRAALRKER